MGLFRRKKKIISIEHQQNIEKNSLARISKELANYYIPETTYKSKDDRRPIDEQDIPEEIIKDYGTGLIAFKTTYKQYYKDFVQKIVIEEFTKYIKPFGINMYTSLMMKYVSGIVKDILEVESEKLEPLFFSKLYIIDSKKLYNEV